MRAFISRSRSPSRGRGRKTAQEMIEEIKRKETDYLNHVSERSDGRQPQQRRARSRSLARGQRPRGRSLSRFLRKKETEDQTLPMKDPESELPVVLINAKEEEVQQTKPFGQNMRRSLSLLSRGRISRNNSGVKSETSLDRDIPEPMKLADDDLVGVQKQLKEVEKKLNIAKRQGKSVSRAEVMHALRSVVSSLGHEDGEKTDRGAESADPAEPDLSIIGSTPIFSSPGPHLRAFATSTIQSVYPNVVDADAETNDADSTTVFAFQSNEPRSISDSSGSDSSDGNSIGSSTNYTGDYTGYTGGTGDYTGFTNYTDEDETASNSGNPAFFNNMFRTWSTKSAQSSTLAPPAPQGKVVVPEEACTAAVLGAPEEQTQSRDITALPREHSLVPPIPRDAAGNPVYAPPVQVVDTPEAGCSAVGLPSWFNIESDDVAKILEDLLWRDPCKPVPQRTKAINESTYGDKHPRSVCSSKDFDEIVALRPRPSSDWANSNIAPPPVTEASTPSRGSSSSDEAEEPEQGKFSKKARGWFRSRLRKKEDNIKGEKPFPTKVVICDKAIPASRVESPFEGDDDSEYGRPAQFYFSSMLSSRRHLGDHDDYDAFDVIG